MVIPDQAVVPDGAVRAVHDSAPSAPLTAVR